MIQFSTRIKRFSRMGEKTGWWYIVISASQAQKLNPGKKVGYRVKGRLDSLVIQRVALLPMGQGRFIIPLNAKMRKGFGKTDGDLLKVTLEVDERTIPPSADFMRCLRDEPRAMATFKTLPGSHQRYYSKWIEEAKTIETKTKRITMAVEALSDRLRFNEMLRAAKERRKG